MVDKKQKIIDELLRKNNELRRELQHSCNGVFPILIEFVVGSGHDLEDLAEEGIDYCKYALIKEPKDLPNNIPFRVVATRVWIF